MVLHERRKTSIMSFVGGGGNGNHTFTFTARHIACNHCTSRSFLTSLPINFHWPYKNRHQSVNLMSCGDSQNYSRRHRKYIQESLTAKWMNFMDVLYICMEVNFEWHKSRCNYNNKVTKTVILCTSRLGNVNTLTKLTMSVLLWHAHSEQPAYFNSVDAVLNI